MPQRRRWGLSWWNSRRISTLRPLSRLSKCPIKTEFHSVLQFVVRRRHNSWWKCRRCCPVPCSSSGMRSKSLTFQFLVVVVVVREVYKVLTQDRVQQHVLWSRSSAFFGAALWRPGGGTPAEDRRACRPGRAHDHPTAFCVSSSADGRTVGGSAYDRVLFFSEWACGADRRHSSSSWSWRSRRREGSSRFTPRAEFNSVWRSSAG